MGFLLFLLVATNFVSVLCNNNGWQSYNQPTVPASCTEINLVNDVPITFTSPGNFPYGYPDNADACWLVRSFQADTKPKVKVITSSIEALVIMGCEAADFVEVRDGESHNSTLMMRWCGWGYPPNIFTPKESSSLYVFFHSDNSVGFGGFEMQAYLNETVLSYFTTTTTTTTANPNAGSNANSNNNNNNNNNLNNNVNDTNTPAPPSETTTIDDANARRFMNDQDSINRFNAQLQQSLQALTGTNSNSAGVIAGIVVGVLVGTILFGLIIHFTTKACMTSSSSSSDMLNGTVIIPSRREPTGFFDLGKGIKNSPTKKHVEKYKDLPGPEISIGVTDISSGGQHVLLPANQMQGNGLRQNPLPAPSAPVLGRTNPAYSQDPAPTSNQIEGPTTQNPLARSRLPPVSQTPQGQTPPSESPQGQTSPRVNPPVNLYSRSLAAALQPKKNPMSPRVPGLQLPTGEGEEAEFIITPRLTARTMMTTGTADQAETHLADVVDTDAADGQQQQEDADDEAAFRSALPPALALNTRLPPLLPPIRAGALPALDLGSLTTDHSNVPPPPLYSMQDPAYGGGNAVSDSLPPLYDGNGNV